MSKMLIVAWVGSQEFVDEVDNCNKCVIHDMQHPKIKRNHSCKYKKKEMG
jgi:phosphotransferase system IIB component